MGETQKLNKAHVEDKEKLVDQKSDQNRRDKRANGSKNNNNIYEDDIKHKNIAQNHVNKKDRENGSI